MFVVLLQWSCHVSVRRSSSARHPARRSAMPIAWPSCPHCFHPMSLGADAVGFGCSACRATTLEEGTLTVRWAIRKKLLASKRTRLTLRIREPEFLFTLTPRIAAYITEGQGAASLNSNPKALVSVRCLQGSVAHPGLHLVSASSGSESEEIHHNFDSNPYCLLPLPVDL